MGALKHDFDRVMKYNRGTKNVSSVPSFGGECAFGEAKMAKIKVSTSRLKFRNWSKKNFRLKLYFRLKF
jgi:hypothetical protein